MGTGEAFVKWLRPAGCVLFLGIMVLTIIVCFTAKGAPVEGYTAPNTSEYYAENLDELSAELEENLFPLLYGKATCVVEGDQIVITASQEDMTLVRSGVIHYYDDDLFIFCEK